MSGKIRLVIEIGAQFGKLTIIGTAPSHRTPSGAVRLKFLCKCQCGSTVSVQKPSLLSGATRSCGCARHAPMTKQIARARVAYALRTGRITKPARCSQCKSPGPVQGHHHRGYENPLDVMWLCAKCHYAIDAAKIRKPGALNGNASLTSEQAAQILCRSLAGGNRRELAEEFGVCESVVYCILAGKSYACTGRVRA